MKCSQALFYWFDGEEVKSISQILEMAVKYSKSGIPIMPIHGIMADGSCTCAKGNDCTSKGKHPIFNGWHEKAATDIETIKVWWKKYPNANIGIPTGAKSGWLVLDVDTKYDGADSVELLEMLYDDLPKTITAITGSGGKHYISNIHPIEKSRIA